MQYKHKWIYLSPNEFLNHSMNRIASDGLCWNTTLALHRSRRAAMYAKVQKADSAVNVLYCLSDTPDES